MLAKPGSLKTWNQFEAEVYVLNKDEGGRHTPFFTKYRPQFFFRTADITGTVSLPKGTEMVMPGDNATLAIELINDTVLEKGQRFAIREGGKTVGAGVVTKLVGSLGAKTGQSGVQAFARAKADPAAAAGAGAAKVLEFFGLVDRVTDHSAVAACCWRRCWCQACCWRQARRGCQACRCGRCQARCRQARCCQARCARRQACCARCQKVSVLAGQQSDGVRVCKVVHQDAFIWQQ